MAASERGALDVALALHALALKDICSHCGKQRAGLKLCSRCKHASYCGAECQNASWKAHKKTCAPPLCMSAVCERVRVAHNAEDWRGVLKWEWRIDELMVGQPDATCVKVLEAFLYAHHLGWHSTGSTDHLLSCVGLGERHINLLGKMQRFRDQGNELCDLGNKLFVLDFEKEAHNYFDRARKIGAAHGFFSVECLACKWLGRLALQKGRTQEAADLLRNALACVPLVEGNGPIMELDVLASLIDAIFETNGSDDLETLVLRYRAAARAEAERTGRLLNAFNAELRSIYYLARLHEARGRPDEAERKVRALLDLVHENGEAVQNMAVVCEQVLEAATSHLKILDPVVGDKGLIESVAVQLAKLRR